MKKIVKLIKKGLKAYIENYARLYSTGYFQVNL